MRFLSEFSGSAFIFTSLNNLSVMRRFCHLAVHPVFSLFMSTLSSSSRGLGASLVTFCLGGMNISPSYIQIFYLFVPMC